MKKRNSEKSPAKRPPRKRRGRWRRRRPLRRLILAVAILSVPTFALYFIPFSSSIFDDWVKSILRDSTGLVVDFEKNVFFIAARNLEMHNVQFKDPETNQTLYAVEKLEVDWHWQFSSLPIMLDTVKIESPESLILEMDAQYRIRPQQRLGSFITVLSQMTRTESLNLSEDIQTPSIRVTDADLIVLSSDPEKKDEIMAGVESMSLDFSVHGERWNFMLRGTLAGEDIKKDEAKIAIQFVPSKDNPGVYRYALHAERLGLAPIFDEAVPSGPFRFFLNGLSFQGDIDTNNIDENISGSLDQLSIDAVRVNLPNFNFHLPGSSLRGQADWSFQYADARLKIKNFFAQVLESDIRGEGDMRFTGEKNFNLAVHNSRLSPLWLNLSQTLASQFLPANANVESGWVMPDMRLAGDRNGLNWDMSRIQLRGQDLKMTAPQFTNETVGPVSFDVLLTSRTLRMPYADIRAGDDHLRVEMLSANLMGNDWQDGLSIGGKWLLNADLEKVMKRARHLGALRKLTLSGNAQGEGMFAGEWIPMTEKSEQQPRRHWALRLSEQIEPVMRRLQIVGSLRVKNARAFHPVLPAPVTGIGGELEIYGNALSASNFKGSMLGSDVQLSASIQGDEFFWVNPQLDFKFKGDINLADAEAMLQSSAVEKTWRSPVRNEILNRVKPGGLVKVDLAIQGPLLKPVDLKPYGSITASNINLDIGSPLSKGLLHLDHILLNLSPEAFVLEDFDGNIGDIKFINQAKLDANGLTASIRIDSPFKSLQDAFPPAFFYAPEVGGHLKIEAETSALVRQGRLNVEGKKSSPGSPLELLARALGKLPEKQELENLDECVGNIGRCFEYDYSATVDIKDGVFAHAFMPNRVTDINGRIFVFPLGMRTDGFCITKWGSSEVGLTSGTVMVDPPPQPFDENPPDSLATIRFESSAPDLYLDEWIKEWGPGRMRPKKEELPQDERERIAESDFDYRKVNTYPMMSDIQGDIRAKKLYFQRFEFTDASGRLSTQYFRNRNSLLEFQNIKAKAYEGEIDTHVAFLMPYQKRFEWQWQSTFHNVNVQPLLTAVYDKEANITGKMDAWIDLRGVGGKQDSFTGKGQLMLHDSQFMNSQLFLLLGKTLKNKNIEEASFTKMHGDFEIAQGWIWIEKLLLDGALFDFAALGRTTLDGKLDLTVAYIPLGYLQGVPVLNWVPKAFSSVTDRLLKVRIGGTVNDPTVRMLAPSVTLPEPPKPATEGIERPPIVIIAPMEAVNLEELNMPDEDESSNQ